MNVQIASGSGSTNGTVNGWGNLIIGYNETGRFTDIRNGSHNLVIGTLNNYSSYGALVSGNFNTATSPFGAALGYRNTASGYYATVTGGQYNTASGLASSISGGQNGKASFFAASVSGGDSNEANGEWWIAQRGGRLPDKTTCQNSSVSSSGQRTTNADYGWAAGTSLDR